MTDCGEGALDGTMTSVVRNVVSDGLRARRVARWAIRVTLIAGVLSVVGGAWTAVVWRPGSPSATAQPSACAAPPCGPVGDGLPGLESLPTVGPVVLLVLAGLVGGLSFAMALVRKVRRSAPHGLAVLTALAAFGPLVVVVGGEVVPHVLSPCAPAELWGAPEPSMCVRTADGVDLPERWHALDHALVGFLPLSLAVAWWWRRRSHALVDR